MAMPTYIKVTNEISAVLLDVVGGKSTFVALGMGALMGTIHGKRATYIFHSVVVDIFWKYIQPRTFQAIFMHPQSNYQARVVGLVLSYATSVSISYLFNKCILPLIREDTPYLGELKQENEDNQPTISQSLYLTAVPTIIAVLRGLQQADRSLASA
jgi:hypothetical protein